MGKCLSHYCVCQDVEHFVVYSFPAALLDFCLWLLSVWLAREVLCCPPFFSIDKLFFHVVLVVQILIWMVICSASLFQRIRKTSVLPSSVFTIWMGLWNDVILILSFHTRFLCACIDQSWVSVSIYTLHFLVSHSKTLEIYYCNFYAEIWRQVQNRDFKIRR